MVKVTTDSGSVYLIDEGTKRLKRLSDNPLRRDDEWITGYPKYGITVGGRMLLVLEPLSEDADVTIRTTTPVASIEQV
jgi:hypothetical protein